MAETEAARGGRETGPSHLLHLLALVLLVLLQAVQLWQWPAPVVHSLGGETMGSTWSVRVVGPRSLDEAALQRSLEARLADLDKQLSGYRPDSDLTRVNTAAPGVWVDLPADLSTVLAFGFPLHRESGGAFDMTVRPLVLLWGFGAAEPRAAPPSAEEIAAARAQLGSDRFEISADGRQIRRLAEVTLDVDAIAPGHAADALSAQLAGMGLGNHLVDIGGELRASGTRPDGQGWHVGIERPALEHGDITRVVAVSGQAVATSGDYRDFFELAGRRYSHTLDPVTGSPVEHALTSVTVLAPTAMAADGYATVLTVLGPERGMAFADSHDLPVYMILRDGNGLFSEHCNRRFQPWLDAIVDGGDTSALRCQDR